MALGARTSQRLPSQAAEYRENPPSGMRIGIALSGGGIRSAAFNLGALQALQERHVLEQAEYLAAVSGGNYIASALTISSARRNPDHDNGKPPWAHGSPEERYLRQHTNYLAPGSIGRVWLALNVLYGFALNYLPFLLCTFVAGRLAGGLLNATGLGLTDLHLDGLRPPSSPVLAAMLYAAAGGVVVAISLVFVRRFRDGSRAGPADYGKTRSERAALWLARLAGALVGCGLVLPVLAELYGSVSTFVLSRVLGEHPDAFDTVRGRVVMAVLWLLVSLLLAAATLGLSRRFRARGLMMVLASLAGGGLLLVPLLSSLEYSTRRGLQSAGDVLAVVAALAVVAFMAVFVHNRRYSLHPFYRERLNHAFGLERRRDPDGQIVAEPIPYHEPLLFSKVGRDLADSGSRLPKLIVCCAVNLSHGVPVGRFAESFTFEHDRSGGRLFGYHHTERFENSGVAGTSLTLPALMAVSGAALSPLMGRFTHPPLRFLLALTNVRLGVWVRNPRHRAWDSGGYTARGPLRRLLAKIVDGWFEPGALYVLREALGLTSSDQRFICSPTAATGRTSAWSNCCAAAARTCCASTPAAAAGWTSAVPSRWPAASSARRSSWTRGPRCRPTGSATTSRCAAACGIRTRRRRLGWCTPRRD